MNRKQKLTLIATIIGSGAVILDSTVVTLALPKIAIGLHGSFADLQWITDGYMLSLSSLILLGGSLGDIFGRKRVYLFGLIGFGITSLICGLAQSASMLIISRLVQGVFGALLVPGGLAIINTNFVAKDRGAAIGSWSAWSAIFAAMGPLLGGYLLTVTSWRWIFFINVPLVIACYLLGSAAIVEGRDENARKVDAVGAVLAMLTLAGLTYGLIEGPTDHWSAVPLISVLLGVVFAVGFLLFEKRSRDPMVRLDLFKSANFSGANIMTFGMYGALAGFSFALTIHLQTVLHYSPIKAGLSLLPVTIFLLLFSKRVGAAAGRSGPRLFMTFGPLLAALGIISMLRLEHSGSYLGGVLPGMILFALGLMLLVAPLTTTVMNSVPDSSSGIASGINNAVSRVAGLIVVALLGLFGTGQSYRFAIILCAVLAGLAGLVSFVSIDNSLILDKS